MITRRKFCKAAGAASLVAGWPTFAQAKSLEAVKVVGIGGAGREVVELLREHMLATSVITSRTVNWSPNLRHQYDLDFSSGFEDGSPSVNVLRAIETEVAGIATVILVAGFSSKRAATLTYEYARSAKQAGATVVSALVSAYPVCWGDVPAAVVAASRVIELSDRAVQLDAKSVGVPFHRARPVKEAISRITLATAEIVLSEIERKVVLSPGCPAFLEGEGQPGERERESGT